MEKKLNILCTICVRGGSKGILNKNLKKINGFPLIYYTIKQAIKSKLFDAIVVSTDSKKIKKLSNKFGAQSWFLRPKKYALNKSAKLPAIRHAFKMSEKYFKKKFDVLIDLDATSPLRSTQDILNSFKKFKSSRCSNLISVCKSKKNPYFNMVELKNKRINLVKKNGKGIINSRQDAPSVYDVNASIYIWKRKSIIKKNKIINSKTAIFEMPYERSIDIDSNIDWTLVEFLLKKRNVLLR